MEEQLRLLADDRPQPWRRGEQEVFIRKSRRAKRLILQDHRRCRRYLAVFMGSDRRRLE